MFWQGPFEAFWWSVQVRVGKLNTRKNNFWILISIKLNCISKFSNQLGSIILQPKVLLILYSQVLHIWFLNTNIIIVLESRQFSLFKKDILKIIFKTSEIPLENQSDIWNRPTSFNGKVINFQQYVICKKMCHLREQQVFLLVLPSIKRQNLYSSMKIEWSHLGMFLKNRPI